MTMQVKPKRWWRGEGEIQTVPSDGGHVILECEVQHPPSRVGKTVYVWLDARDVTDVLKLCRTAAINARSKPMSEP